MFWAPLGEPQPTGDAEAASPDAYHQMDLETFWRLASEQMSQLEPEAAALYMGQDYMTLAHSCECLAADGTPQKTMLTQDVAGDFFWVCTTRTCRYVRYAMTRLRANPAELFDTG